ncbi:MAG TPA: GAP family protein [Streptosporangiaceae bacterium]|nr:GAP family protein [Streptosporangiaceae bacterium]
MGSLLAIVAPLALGAAVSPTLFALQVLVLSGRRHPAARGWALAGGAAAVLVVCSVLGLTLLGNPHTAHHHRSPTHATIEFVAAALLALLAARALFPGKTVAEAHKDRAQGRLAEAPTILFAGVGGLGMLVNFSTLLLFVAALHQISRSPTSLTGKAVTWLILFAITLLPVLVPVTLVAILGRRVSPLLGRVNAFVGDHSRQITAGIELLFTAILIWKGIGELS